MQNYTIFNKHNKVLIAKNSSSLDFSPNTQIIHCNSEILNAYDFSSLFADDQTQDFLLLTDNETTETVFNIVTSSLIFIKAAGGIVRNENDDYLFIFRNNYWDLPKGHWEEGETMEQTAVREVLEECGMKELHLRKFLASSFHTYILNGKREIKQTFWYDMFCSSLQSLTPQKEEGINKIVWIKKEDLSDTLSKSYPNIRHLFKTINDNRNKD